ncbi:MAG: DEAD/DEAH box helicase [Acidimicrobiia bacterium]|nr:DEAD/DEAH box helicase [Acidimicrobiia bacterium]
MASSAEPAPTSPSESDPMALAEPHHNLLEPHEAFLASIVDDPRCVHTTTIPSAEARPAELHRPLPAAVSSVLPAPTLWSHQVEAIDLIRRGRSVAIATATGSGKSLCYQVPLLEAATGPDPATALLVFPTKALAQDQVRSLAGRAVPGLTVVTYDGDTEATQRSWARTNATVLATNPEMLHHGLLAGHERWATFFRRLRHVVVDELHVLRGVFGSHTAHVLRRLRRLCHHYGADPTFVFTSGTLGEPARLASDLSGLDVHPVTDDGSPRAERHFVVWNPAAALDEGPPASPASDGAAMAARLVSSGFRTIVFCPSRKLTEVVAADLRRRLPERHARHVAAYRAGYLRQERRTIEERLFSGELRAVVATSALELGIDVGGLDAAVLIGFPGTVASMWQQAGRAGRGEAPSVTVLVAGEDQLDQWMVAHPTELFTRPPEPAVVNVSNPAVADTHLACAAYELPLTADDERWWPGLLDETVRRLVLDDQLRVVPTHRRCPNSGPAAVWAGRGRPSHGVSLRSATSDEVRITSEGGELIGTVDADRAPRQVHPGAVYLHQGVTWRVADLDLDDLVALVEPCDDGEYTRPDVDTQVTITAIDDEAVGHGVTRQLGAVRVRSQVVGYRRHATRTGEVLGHHTLDLPPSVLCTRAFWWTVDDDLLDAVGVDAAQLPGALHAAEHALIGMLPLVAICDRWDVGGFSTAFHPDTGRATVLVHDAYAGGAGLAELGYARLGSLLAATVDLVAACGCTEGCPSCVQSPKCGNNNEPLDKDGALAMLRMVTGRTVT